MRTLSILVSNNYNMIQNMRRANIDDMVQSMRRANDDNNYDTMNKKSMNY